MSRTAAAAEVAALLIRRRWQLTSTTPVADLWQSPETGAELYVPNQLRRGTFEWSGTVKRIAQAQNQRPADVERDLELGWYDVTRFRVDNDSLGTQTIPLEAGSKVVTAAFGMFRAAATTARRPRQNIAGNYSRLGDDLAREARLAHTEVGSFVFPVLMRVGDPPEQQEEPLSGIDVESVPGESAERRVVRTLAQALSVYEKHIIAPAREVRTRDLTPVIVAGGTREIFTQVDHVLKESAVGWLETDFQWATAEASPANAPERVVIPSDARELVAQTVRLMSEPPRDDLRVIVGPVTHIGWKPGDSLGEVVIQAPNGNRVSSISAKVPRELLTDIHHWMDTATTVVVQGIVRRPRGRTAYLEGVVRPQMLSETLEGIEA